MVVGDVPGDVGETILPTKGNLCARSLDESGGGSTVTYSMSVEMFSGLNKKSRKSDSSASRKYWIHISDPRITSMLPSACETKEAGPSSTSVPPDGMTIRNVDSANNISAPTSVSIKTEISFLDYVHLRMC